MGPTYTLKELIEALIAIRTNTPFDQVEITTPVTTLEMVTKKLPEDLSDIQGIIDAVDAACTNHVGAETYCVYELTKLFNRTPQTIRRWARSGRIPAIRNADGRLTGLFLKSDIHTMMEGGVL